MSSSKDVEQLRADHQKAQEKYSTSYIEYESLSAQAANFEKRLQDVQEELSQLSSSGSAAQNARGYAPDYSMGTGEYIIQKESKLRALRNEINELPNSIAHYQEEAAKALAKVTKSQEKVQKLEERLKYLNQNQMYDCDNWYPMGGPGDDEDGGAAGSSSYVTW
ncbi:hypothetical protein AU210_016459 [Fusarium oxysporum f. sp. radicis-cucumerinum]|uniref:Uncharacterized protein n=1 Tax=Fusarium oxysporum f. sp. radicis-cucumerinum TaxID=327505 RepID=A0A2H3FMS6_FUSOX|nr:hypothetical protein AU210_016721 [Fusarium oxysporum f. sp. radicis-cucumerinum]PCD21497.1 hypothetical protein AU210_016459 [Fusarium oxysporum f. sp. radicis-cucumerinum]